MPRWQVIESVILAAGAVGYERREISGVRSREASRPPRPRTLSTFVRLKPDTTIPKRSGALREAIGTRCLERNNGHHWRPRAVTSPVRALALEYSGKAAAYDALWAPVIGPMAKPLFNALPLASARRVLDVGAGTGTHLQDLRRAAPDACLMAIDSAEGMLRIALRSGHATVAAMDAQALALRAGSIDVAALIFMLFHVPDPHLALTEVRRVLRPGGVAGVVTWGRTDTVPGVAVWKEELDRAGAAADSRDPASMQQTRMDTPEKVSSLLTSAGFAQVRVWSETASHRWTVEDIVRAQLGCGVAARRIHNLSRDAVDACVARVRRRLESLSERDMIQQPEVLFASGT